MFGFQVLALVSFHLSLGVKFAVSRVLGLTGKGKLVLGNVEGNHQELVIDVVKGADLL